jgi:hypothetical protein
MGLIEYSQSLGKIHGIIQIKKNTLFDYWISVSAPGDPVV